MMIRTPGRAYRETGKTRLAFAMIYFVWGSAVTAIRAGIREVPPFLFAAMHSMVAGLVLCRWMIARSERSRSRASMDVGILARCLIRSGQRGRDCDDTSEEVDRDTSNGRYGITPDYFTSARNSRPNKEVV